MSWIARVRNDGKFPPESSFSFILTYHSHPAIATLSLFDAALGRAGSWRRYRIRSRRSTVIIQEYGFSPSKSKASDARLLSLVSGCRDLAIYMCGLPYYRGSFSYLSSGTAVNITSEGILRLTRYSMVMHSSHRICGMQCN